MNERGSPRCLSKNGDVTSPFGFHLLIQIFWQPSSQLQSYTPSLLLLFLFLGFEQKLMEGFSGHIPTRAAVYVVVCYKPNTSLPSETFDIIVTVAGLSWRFAKMDDNIIFLVDDGRVLIDLKCFDWALPNYSVVCSYLYRAISLVNSPRTF